jgi:hypothetical protein
VNDLCPVSKVLLSHNLPSIRMRPSHSPQDAQWHRSGLSYMQAALDCTWHEHVLLRSGSGAQERPQVVEPVEQVSRVRRGALFPVRVQVGQRGFRR